jgi:hypothetical protein
MEIDMKQTTNITLSFPKHLIVRLHKHLPKGQISKFTTDALSKALDDLEKQREADLEAAYEAASSDKEREEEAKSWSELDFDKIEGWEWEHEE